MRRTEDLPEFRNIEICSPIVKRVLLVVEQRNIVVKSAKSVLLANALRDTAVRRSLYLVMPALFPQRLDVTEFLTLILGGDRTAPTISESNSPEGTTGTEDVPQFRQSCVETVPADLQWPSTVTHIFTPKVERCTVTDSWKFAGIRAGTAARVVLCGIGDVR
ncbi:unnamed protein product [Macrosiphum euphorbiae]|uniref:Uncharacterized protein n=1 Tax=Macrosiphum euphorbiae TaxID=13131 RepID=A0AAV0XAI3_9HEMI|nr:unnamed protein product [Macrosiphum euphorbiae]